MRKHLVLAGGGHAHLMTLANLHRFIEKGHTVSLIGPSEYHYYSGMGPGMLGRVYRPKEIRFATRKVVEKKGGRFVPGRIVKIDAEAKQVHLAAGPSLPYDVLSCNIGSYVPQHLVKNDQKDIYPVKPIERLLAAQKRIIALGAEKKITVGIIGGGASAIEIAGNIRRLTSTRGTHPAHIKILTGSLLPRSPEKIRIKALASLKKQNIDLQTACKIKEIRTGRVTEDSGTRHAFDIIFIAVGVVPPPVFSASGLSTAPDGGMRVNRYLQSTRDSHIFGGGDCIHFQPSPLDKVGVYAVRQNPILFHNLMAALEDTPLRRFVPQKDYLTIFNLGDGTGIFYKRPICFSGRAAFLIKNHIDRKFMRRFQAIE